MGFCNIFKKDKKSKILLNNKKRKNFFLAKKIKEKQLKKGFIALHKKLKAEKFNQYKIDFISTFPQKVNIVEEEFETITDNKKLKIKK